MTAKPRNISGGSAEDQHTRAASDLLARIPDEGQRRIADVPAGPWSTRAMLAKRFPGAEVVAIELSRKLFTERSIAEFDLVFSSADLEWRPALRRLLPDLAPRLAPGGRLAVQFPNNLYEAYRALLRIIAADGPWTKTLLPVAKSRPFNETMEGLYALLKPICASVDIWETTYLCVLSGISAIVDFVTASSLGSFLTPLDERSQRMFLDRYAAELTQAYPAEPDGGVLIRVPRIFLVARR